MDWIYRVAVCVAFGGHLFLSGCASTGTVDGPVESAPDSGIVGATEPVAANIPEVVEAGRPAAPRDDKAEFNQQLMTAVGQQSVAQGSSGSYEYIVGPDDVLEIAVFDVEELNLKVRVSGRGTILVPLVGELDIADKTVSQIEKLLTAKLAQDFIYNPQVSVFVAEYRSQEIAVSGAVNSPAVFYTNKPRTILQMLAMAGGLSDKASYRINVQTYQKNPDGEGYLPQSLFVDIRELVKNEQLQRVALRGGDSIFVPEAGTIFVEGAVDRPGSYPIQGESNVLKAIALAGGTTYDAIDSAIQVIRDNNTGVPEIFEVDLDKVRSNEATDVALEDGDVVLVKSNKVTKGFVIFWREFTRLINPFSA